MTGSGAGRTNQLCRKNDYWHGSFFAMGSPCELLTDAADESIAKQLLDVVSVEAWRVEDKFSRYLPGNIIAQINSSKGAAVEVDDETADLLDFAETLHQLSDGLFDITSGILGKLWHFDGSDRIPDADDVTSLLPNIGWGNLDWSRPRLSLLPGMQIDLGGLGKEYAVDRAGKLLAEHSEAGCLVNYGGDLVATGSPNDTAGWRVGIEKLDETPALAGQVIRLARGGLATSGDARRYLKKGGIRFGHILNPTTGWPIAGAPRSVTVAADTCTQAGMLATLAMLNGAAAESFLDGQGVRYWCLR